MKDRRISERIILNPHMEASLSCIIQEEQIDIDSVCILDINLDGLKFKSTKILPIDTEAIICTLIPKDTVALVVSGNIVYKSIDKDGAYTYGVQLFLSDEETENMLDFLHNYVLDKPTYTPCKTHKKYDGINQREYYRYHFTPHVKACMTVRDLDGRETDIVKEDICLLDISAIGLRILSSHNILDFENKTVDIHVTILDQDIRVVGKILRCSKNIHKYEYALKLYTSDSEQTKIVRLINVLEVKKKAQWSNTHGFNKMATCNCT